MGQKELSELAEKLLNDGELRGEFARDPQAAAERAGIPLDDDDRRALRDLGVHEMDDAELVARVSKRDASVPLVNKAGRAGATAWPHRRRSTAFLDSTPVPLSSTMAALARSPTH